MLEAVNSVLQTAPVIRGNTEQVSTAASYAANPASVQKIPQAPYISPYIHLDVDLGAVLQIRDSETGDVVRQIPSEATIEARQRFQQQIALQEQQVRSRTGSEAASAVVAQTPRAPVQEQAAPAPVRRPAPQPKQLAAFQAAAASGSAGNSAGVTLLA
jgi:hypothetical protein